jgi:PIN domain nuclease of toxin-antitoxin system
LLKKAESKLNMGSEEWIALALTEFPLREATLTTEVILAMIKIHLPHQDPADTFLAATAKVFQLTLVTADNGGVPARAVSFLSLGKLGRSRRL